MVPLDARPLRCLLDDNRLTRKYESAVDAVGRERAMSDAVIENPILNSPFDPPIPADYRRWNEALAAEFFPPRSSGPVYLDPNEATLAELAASIGVDGTPATAFVTAVKETLFLDVPRHFLYVHDEWFGSWLAAQEDVTPPMVALLALFVYASTQMVDDQNYFKPLAKLLGVANTDAFHHGYNSRVRHFWAALNRWIVRTGRGVPTAYPQDIRANVSLLLTQRFLSTYERELLPAFFSRTRLVPGVALTIPEMEDHIRRHAHALPEELKAEWRRHSDRFAEVACNEFESWAGQDDVSRGGDEPEEAALLLGLHFDRGSERIEFPLVVTSSAVPAGDYFFHGASEDSVVVQAAISELGGKLTFDEGEGERIARGPRMSADGVAALLSESVTLSSRSGFRLERDQCEINLFLPLSVSSYIEAPRRRLPLGTRFSLLVSDSVARDSSFASLIGGAEPERRDGCPGGWLLYRDLQLSSVPTLDAESPHAAEIARLLPAPQTAVIDLQGGIPLAGPTRAGRAWLACTPPTIVVVGDTEGAEVELHLHPADGAEGTVETLRRGSDNHFERPGGESDPPAGMHYLYVTRGSSTLASRKLQLVSSDTPRVEMKILRYLVGEGFGVISARDAVGAGPALEAATVCGASWSELEPLSTRTSVPPSSLATLATEPEDRDDEALTLGPVADHRPDSYKHLATPRRRPAKHVLEIYERELRDAAARRRADSDGVPAVCGREDADRQDFICTRVAGHAGVHVYERHRSERLLIPRRFGDTFAAFEQPQGDT